MGEGGIEERKASANMGTDPNIDIDEALSYIDNRIQDILGHYQKDFEGEVSADTLGARFGGYGSFLPTYLRTPSILSNPRNQQKVQNNTKQASSNDGWRKEGATWNSTISSNDTLPVGPKPASSSVSPLHVGRPSSVDTLVKVQSLSENVSICEPVKVPANQSGQGKMKFRIKVRSNNGLLAQKNAAIYSNLGLDMSPSSSLEDSHREREGDFSDSPSCIVNIMTSFPTANGVILSPLHDSLVTFLEEKDPLGYNRTKAVRESRVVCAREEVPGEKKSTLGNKGGISVECNTERDNDSFNNVSAGLKKEITAITSKPNYKLSIASNHPPDSNEISKVGEVADSRCTISGSHGHWAKMEMCSQKPCKIDNLNAKATLTGKNERDKKLQYRKDDRNKVGKNLDSCKESCGMPEGMTDCQSRTMDLTGQKFGLKCTSHQHNKMKVSHGGEQPSAASKKTPQGNQYCCCSSAGKSKNTVKFSVPVEPKDEIFCEGYFPYKRKGDDKLRRDSSKTKVRLTDSTGDTKVGSNESRSHLLGTPIKDNARNYKLASEKKIAVSNNSMDRSFCKNTGFLSTSAELSGDVKDVMPLADPHNVEDWVCCDRCRTWRLLPYDMNPHDLPEKWVCSMLSWLPGMNRCDFSEDETADALRALYQLPVTENHNFHQSYDNLDQNPQVPSFTDEKKKLGSNPVQHSAIKKQMTSMVKNEGTIVKCKCLQNRSQFPLESKVEKRPDHVKALKVKSKRDADQDGFKLSKKVKIDGMHYADDQKIGGLSKKEVEVNDNKYRKYSSSRDMRFFTTDLTILSVEKTDNQVQAIENQDKIEIVGKKRKVKDKQDNPIYQGKYSHMGYNLADGSIATEQMSRNEYSKKKKLRKSKSEEKDAHGKANADVKDQIVGNHFSLYKEDINGGDGSFNVNYLSQQTADNKDSATSSSSMISGTCKVKIKYRDFKRSPVGLVCSSPSRISKQPRRSLSGKDGGLNVGLSQSSSQTRSLEAESFGVTDCPEMVGNFSRTHYRSNNLPFFEYQNEVTGNRKCMKVTSPTDHSSVVPNNVFAGGCVNSQDHDNENPREPRARNHSRDLERLDSNYYPVPLLQKCANGSSSGTKVNLTSMCDFDMGRKKVSDSYSEQKDSHCVKSRVETHEAADGSDCEDLPRTPKHIGKNYGQDGLQDVELKHLSPDLQEPSEIDSPNPIREDDFSWAANSALKEAKNLRHAAYHLKISGSGHESTEQFFEAALKFFHEASRPNPSDPKSANHGKMTSAEMYGSAAKLCEYCACEYERCNDLAYAALAYKCMEVAYMLVVYSNDFTASKKWNELQMALQQSYPAESPSSSVSDVDNLNNELKVEKMRTAKDVCPLQVAGDLVITAGNCPNFVRFLNFVQDVNHAMEASRKSQIAFVAAKVVLAEIGNMEGISSIKKVLDISFHDVKELLRLLPLAMESLSRTS